VLKTTNGAGISLQKLEVEAIWDIVARDRANEPCHTPAGRLQPEQLTDIS
jgi:hypothetical protein